MKKFILFLVVTFGLATILTLSLKTHAQDLFPACDNTTSTAAACERPTQTHTSNRFYGKNGIITKIVGLYAIGTGVVAVIMIIVSGFKLVTSSGDPNNIKSAKNTIIFAVAGLVIAAIAGLIVQFVLNKL